MRLLGLCTRVLLLAWCYLADARADAHDSCEPLLPEKTDTALTKANEELAQAQEAFDDAGRRLALTQKAHEAAVADLTAQPASAVAKAAVIQDSSSLRYAADERKTAQRALDEATKRVACVQEQHDAARRFVHGVGLAASGAHAADQTERLGLALRYIHPSDSALTWEVAFGVSRFRLSRPDEDRETLFNLLYRWSFGRDRVAFSLGSGLAWLPKRADEIAAPRSYAAIGEISVAFRVNHKCPATSSICVTPWADLRPFVQPWLPFDGSPAAILFGLELGASIGFKRSKAE